VAPRPFPRRTFHAVLVSTAWLEEHLGDRGVVMVDMRWRGAGSSRELYGAGHVPGAAHLNWSRDLVDPDHPVAFMLAPRERFASVTKRAGIGDGSTVVAYADEFGSGRSGCGGRSSCTDVPTPCGSSTGDGSGGLPRAGRCRPRDPSHNRCPFGGRRGWRGFAPPPGAGLSASAVLYALHRAGFEEGALYDGSWEESARDLRRPVDRG
jgi:3-mercaptopyruvate sulfurtransferase SseA